MMYFLMPDSIAAEFEYDSDCVVSNGKCTAICSVNGGKYTVKRLLSTNPNDYINPAFAPNSIWGKVSDKKKNGQLKF